LLKWVGFIGLGKIKDLDITFGGLASLTIYTTFPQGKMGAHDTYYDKVLKSRMN